jgi:hypothetical protein
MSFHENSVGKYGTTYDIDIDVDVEERIVDNPFCSVTSVPTSRSKKENMSSTECDTDQYPSENTCYGCFS